MACRFGVSSSTLSYPYVHALADIAANMISPSEYHAESALLTYSLQGWCHLKKRRKKEHSRSYASVAETLRNDVGFFSVQANFLSHQVAEKSPSVKG